MKWLRQMHRLVLTIAMLAVAIPTASAQPPADGPQDEVDVEVATGGDATIEDALGTESVWLPDYAQAQFAGDMGLVSAGFGYSFLRRVVEFDLSYGYAPGEIADVHMATARLSSSPFALSLGSQLSLYPVRVGTVLNYTFGDQFWIRHPNNYPDDYYSHQTALRYGPLIGSSLLYRFAETGALDGLDLYYELSTNDLEIELFRNNRSISALDILALGFGIKLFL